MDRDFKVHDDGVDPWDEEIEEDRDLVIFLNRVAIASSQSRAVEHPVVEFSAGKKRASVTAIRGQLFYSDLHRPNVQNLNVIAEEIVGFLTDRITPGAHELNPAPAEAKIPMARYSDGGAQTVRVLRAAAVVFLGAILVLCGLRVYQTLTYRPSLVDTPPFVPGVPDEAAFLGRYSGVYIDAVEDAGQVIEITPGGRFRLYELWRKQKEKGFELEPVEDLPVSLGTSEGRDAILAADVYLVVPLTEDRVTLFGELFLRYDRKKDRLSLWPDDDDDA
jgi:hypothetical protein